MLEFRKISLDDKEWVSQIFKNYGYRGSELTFSNMFNWSGISCVEIARFKDTVIAKSKKGDPRYFIAVGGGDIKEVIDLLEQEARAAGVPLKLYGMPKEMTEKLEELYSGRFKFTSTQDNSDYIYLREKLSTLAGKKLHGKRNHINRFLDENPDWKFEVITKENIHEAWEMNKEWCAVNDCNSEKDLQDEACAVRSAFQNYFEIGLIGGMLKTGNRVVAFSFGSPVTDDTFVVHVEKAFADVQGAYPMINREFVRNLLGQYTYVNREDDTGDEGLRRAKESYRPDMMYERYTVIEN